MSDLSHTETTDSKDEPMGEQAQLRERWRQAAKDYMEHDLGWDDLAESHDAALASDAAVLVVLRDLRGPDVFGRIEELIAELERGRS